MEGVIRSTVTNPFNNTNKMCPQSVGGRELHFVIRKLGSCACRNPELFLELACDTVRVCSEPPAPSVYTSTQRIPPCMVKCALPPKSENIPLNNMQRDLVNLLIDRLCAEEEAFESDSKSAAGLEEKIHDNKMDEDGGGGRGEGASGVEVHRAMHFSDGRRGRARRGSYRRQVTTGTYDDDDVNSEDMAVDGEETGNSRMASALSGPTTSPSSPTDERYPAGDGSKSDGTSRDKPLMTKAAILRLLSELVEAYSPCARLISESSRKVKVHGQPPKDMTVLAFVFDHLLPASCGTSNKVPPIAKLSKTFIQCLAVSHPSPETISLLVTEFKHALARALSLSESNSKHNRIRALTGLLSQISDHIMASRGALNPSHFARLLIRKGFISDLARAVHSLNLSSSMLPGTINSILKPLEVLTKIVNQVATSSKKTEGGDKVSSGEGSATGRGGEEQSRPLLSTVANPPSNQVSITVNTTTTAPVSAPSEGVAAAVNLEARLDTSEVLDESAVGRVTGKDKGRGMGGDKK